ncbi:MAG: hypothetical protein KatS3mg064_1663 [Tepidiforma sp.]|nr:acetyl-CoA carboxylase biotin carboxyl carrier protein subunit [Tepidiforma sp.]GIW18506.1 MAG: hypothetical protein KatS3mg064_1663 [Tepidiforma sp.]
MEDGNGHRWTFRPALPPAPARRAADAGGGRGAEAVAPLAGTVAAVLVGAGQAVAPGDVLCVVHAMKMEHPVRADAAGVVAEVCAAPGAAVAAGEVLVRMEARAG